MKIFEQRIIKIYGEKGKVWLEQLPFEIQKIANEYHLTELKTIDNLNFNYVCSAIQQSASVILKISPNIQSISREIHCLRHLSGKGGIPVIASGHNWVILKKADAQVDLKNQFPKNEAQTCEVIANFIKQLQNLTIPESHSFLSVYELVTAVIANSRLSDKILQKLEAIHRELRSTSSKEILLHGDLHHENVLKYQNTWVMIDPKGIIGPPEYELATFLSNPMPDLLNQPNIKELLKNRVDMLCSLCDFSKEVVCQYWSLKTILCWSWMVEDNLDPAYFEKLLSIINEVNPSF